MLHRSGCPLTHPASSQNSVKVSKVRISVIQHLRKWATMNGSLDELGQKVETLLQGRQRAET